MVAPPTGHASGKHYDWLEGFEPWTIPVLTAPPELTAAIEALRLEAGGATGSHEQAAPPEAVKNAFEAGYRYGREDKLKALAWAIVVDARRNSPQRPTTAALEDEIAAAFIRYDLQPRKAAWSRALATITRACWSWRAVGYRSCGGRWRTR